MWTYLGQNFLIDSKIKYYIFEKIQKLYTDLWCEALIEIGPGKGSITTLIHSISPNFFVIEKDETLIGKLTLKIDYLQLIIWDVLDVDVEKLLQEKKLSPKKTLVVWNLPYYITSPILRKFFENGNQEFAGWIFMVQDEVGQKLRRDAKKKSYLRWLLNYAYDVTYLKWVPAKCFKPAPKVKSCLIQLTTKNEELCIEWDKFIAFLEMFAPFSRKTLWAIQKMIQKKSDIQRHNEKSKSYENFHDVEVVSKLKIVKSVGWIKFIVPESLQKKRLEELTWKNLETILVR